MTAKEFLDTQVPDHISKEGYSFGDIGRHTVEIAMIEFAKHHVEQALIAASEDAIIINRTPNKEDDRVYKIVDENSILNAYPLSKIK